MWRRFPEMVESAEFPFRADFVARQRHEPSDEVGVDQESLAPDYRESQRYLAIELAKSRMEYERKQREAGR
jgi:hypothetical protein